MAAFLRVEEGGVLHLAIFEFLLPEVCRQHEGNEGRLHFFLFCNLGKDDLLPPTAGG